MPCSLVVAVGRNLRLALTVVGIFTPIQWADGATDTGSCPQDSAIALTMQSQHFEVVGKETGRISKQIKNW